MYNTELNSMNNSLEALQEENKYLRERMRELEGQVVAFFTGVVPSDNTSLATILMAQYGRQRLEKIYGDSVNIPISVLLKE